MWANPQANSQEHKDTVPTLRELQSDTENTPSPNIALPHAVVQRPQKQGGNILYIFLKDSYAYQQIKVSVNL